MEKHCLKCRNCHVTYKHSNETMTFECHRFPPTQPVVHSRYESTGFPIFKWKTIKSPGCWCDEFRSKEDNNELKDNSV